MWGEVGVMREGALIAMHENLCTLQLQSIVYYRSLGFYALMFHTAIRTRAQAFNVAIYIPQPTVANKQNLLIFQRQTMPL